MKYFCYTSNFLLLFLLNILLSTKRALAQLTCALTLSNGTTITFERGESFGSLVIAEGCGPAAENYPCFCEPLLENESIQCPYCGFENADGAADCALDGESAILNNPLGTQQCTCDYLGGSTSTFSNCLPIQPTAFSPSGPALPPVTIIEAPSSALPPFVPPAMSPMSNIQPTSQCVLQISASPERCDPLLETTTEDCDCYDFCGTTVVGCKAFGEGGRISNPCQSAGGFSAAVFGCPRQLEAPVTSTAPTTIIFAPAVVTEAPDTSASPIVTSESPATLAPFTLVPISQAPVIMVPFTDLPDTGAPITGGPTTQAPVIDAPVTQAPVITTLSPAVTTNAPMAMSPVEVLATLAPITEAPITIAPMTTAPMTTAPITTVPTTLAGTPAPFDGEKRCLLKISAEQCNVLLSTTTEECDCYSFCGGELIECNSFNESGGGIVNPCQDQGGIVAAVFGCSNNEEEVTTPTGAPSGSAKSIQLSATVSIVAIVATISASFHCAI